MKEQTQPFSPGRTESHRSRYTEPSAQPPVSLDTIWPRYLEGGYFDASGKLKRDYLIRSKVVPLAEALGKAGLTTHQLHRFFQHCRTIEAKLRSGSTDWSMLETEFLRIDWAASNALGRQVVGFPRLFHDFLTRNVSAVKTESDFQHGFLPHFEALVGFSSVYLKSSNQK